MVARAVSVTEPENSATEDPFALSTTIYAEMFTVMLCLPFASGTH